MILSLTSSLFANAQVTAGTTQLNQINFDPAISLSEVREYLKNNQFKNLKSASIVADLETKDFVLPINLDLNLDDDNNNSKTITSYQSTKKAIIDGIRQAKKDINKPKQKFDSKKLLESFQVSSSSTLPAGAKLADEVANLPKPPAPTLPTEEELKYYEDNGVLPPIKVDPIQIKKLIKDSGLPENYPVPHLDPIQKGKFSNSRPEDVYNSMTPAERTANQKKVDEAKLQEELVKKTTEEEIQNIELDNTANKTPELKVSQLNYYTEVGDSNAKDTGNKANKPNSKEAKEENKPKLQRNDEARKTKQNSQDEKTKKNSKRIEDKVKDIVTQDITGLFKVSDEETAKTKTETEKQKQNWLNNAKTNRQQLNEYEAEGYIKEGLDLTTLNVDVIDGNTNKPKTKSQVQDLVNRNKKTSNLVDLLKFGSIKADAKGLNNALYPLMIYTYYDEGLVFNHGSRNWGQQIYLTSNRSGDNYTQRYCFDNGSNRVYLTNGSTCTGIVYNQTLCLDVYGGVAWGAAIALWGCHDGSNQKWVLDENGRLALKNQPDMCMEKAWGISRNQLDKGMVLWGCNGGAGRENQEYRAGYNNFGQITMGMTIWAAQTSIISMSPTPGHAFISLYNSVGLHNTFSRWPGGWNGNGNDDNCSNDTGKINNICDFDALYVDRAEDWDYARFNNASFRKRSLNLPKHRWDKIVFGSGFRDNWLNGTNVNLGSYGTYDWLGNSKSRVDGYNALYRIDILEVCSTYTYRLWNAHRVNEFVSGIYIDPGFDDKMIPSDIFNQI